MNSPDAREYLLKHFHELPMFEGELDEESRNAMAIWLFEHVILNETAQTTEEEARDFIQFAMEKNVDSIIAFTFPMHGPRASIVDYKAKISAGYGGMLFNTISDTSPAWCGPDDLAILEKPHRSDGHIAFSGIHLMGKGIISLLRKFSNTPGVFTRFEKEFWALVEKYQED